MKGFIVYSTYDVIEEKTQIQVFGRLENNDSFVALMDFTPYFYIREKDLDKAKSLLSKFSSEKTKMTNFAGEEVAKITSNAASELTKLASALHKKNINTYEADIKPNYRFMYDNNLLNSIEIDGDYEKSEKVDRIYKNPEINPTKEEFKPKLKTIAMDIESDKKMNNLFCIGLYGENYKKNFIISNKKIPHTISCKDESDLLEKFKEEIIKIDPDIITGWNVIDFDFLYLKEKFAKNKIQFDLGRTNENTRVKIQSGFFRDSTVDMPGRQVLDGLNMIKDPFIKEAPTIKSAKFNSYTLEDVSQALLGEGKKLVGKGRHEELEKMYASGNHEELVNYNLQDCKLAYDIVIKTNIIDLAIERVSLTGMPLSRLTASIAAFDSLYIREANKRGLVSPTTKYEEKKKE